ncbi:hypothetical protein F511_16479 [Dorcoceras hygrometricum]|uniref:Uncharacterized protein n=1 Tax=Dorcoceras hygrometricum TaxID=472368 RepID=A0A2Z7D0Z0_9LAMI|nr:hypothetical protein F511_16479 [Dorcoceras hygrometricum]
MVKRLATSRHDPLDITDSACKNQLVVVSVQYGPFNTYIPIRSTTIGKSRVARDSITMHTSWRSNSDIASVTRQTHLPKTHPVLWPDIYHTIIFSDSIGYPRMKASGESSTTKHRLLHASGPHPITPPSDPNGISAVGVFVKIQQMVCDQQLNGLSSSADRFIKSNQQMLLSRSAADGYSDFNQQVHYMMLTSRCFTKIAKRCRLNKLTRHRFIAKGISRWKNAYAYQQVISSKRFSSRSVLTTTMKVSMMFLVVRTNQYNQDLRLIHSTNGNHLESPNEGNSIDHQVTTHLHAQNITMFPTNETWYFTSQMLVSSSGGLILILTVQSTRNKFRIHSDY